MLSLYLYLTYSKECTFNGYGEDEFGYRLWDDENKKMVRNRDVIFNDRVMCKDWHNTSYTTTRNLDVREFIY
jgi:hypothetical protein